MMQENEMVQISKAEYDEYQQLKAQRDFVLKLESAQNLTLENDIDTPIKRCVMALALWGCEPYWSCCGFNYSGQPIHKSHQNHFAWVVFMPKVDVVAPFDISSKSFLLYIEG